MAHKKAGGSSRNGRDSKGQRLGVKIYSGQAVRAIRSAAVHRDRLVVDIVSAILHRPDAHSDGPDWVFGD